MIRPLRRRHRTLIVALALIVGPLFVAGLMARRPTPEAEFPAAWRAAAAPDAGETQLHNTGSGLSLKLTVLGAPSAPSAESAKSDTRPSRLQIELLNEPKRPELLVYWQPGSGPVEAIGDSSVLVGALVGTAPVVVDLPEAALTDSGQLVFYSLTQAEVVDTIAPRLPVLRKAP